MTKNSVLTLFTFLLFSITSSGQNQFGIMFQEDIEQNCSRFNKVFTSRPKEVKFNAVRKGDRIYLRVTDEAWLKKLMNNKFDGIAIDVISKDLYTCGTTLPDTQIRGTLLKPVYKDKLLKALKNEGPRNWRTLVGIIPAELRDKSLEFNILFLSNKTMCQYYNIYNLESYPWNLLDMGIYLDKITYKETGIISNENSQKTKSKTFNFLIPFEKNKSQYSAQDVKPIYDSLDLTDFKISKIKINAYASVEGSVAINRKLQTERGNSIVNALKSYTKGNVQTEVQTSENWTEFFQSIQNTPFADFKDLSKEDIKKKLVGVTAQQLEPLLSEHRKGLITIELTKIERYKNMSSSQLVSTFNSKLTEGDLENAMIIQQALFDRSLKESNPEILNKMEIPQQLKYADFNNNKAVFGYYEDPRNALIAKNKLLKVLEVAPINKKVRYNLAAINIYMYRYDFEAIDERDLRKEVLGLKKYGINDKLIQRMMLNINIIKAEKKQREKKYAEKDKAVSHIKNAYKHISLSNKDYLSLAQFLTYYDNTQSSINLLKPIVNKVDVNEDLLFYYINQTVVRDNYVAQDEYRAILSNAYSQNPRRFCKLFDASTQDGVTFQLLHNDYLRRSYCDDCSQ